MQIELFEYIIYKLRRQIQIHIQIYINFLRFPKLLKISVKLIDFNKFYEIILIFSNYGNVKEM